MLNLRADVESERSLSSTVEELRGMMIAMREEMTSLQVHNVEQFASQLQAIESKNEILSRNMEQVIAYENKFAEYTRQQFASVNTPFVPGRPEPPVILSMSPQTASTEHVLCEVQQSAHADPRAHKMMLEQMLGQSQLLREAHRVYSRAPTGRPQPASTHITPPPAQVEMPAPSLHCGFCNTDFTGDVSRHKSLCWPIHARLKIQTPHPPLNEYPPVCPPGSPRICGACQRCIMDARNYVYGGMCL